MTEKPANYEGYSPQGVRPSYPCSTNPYAGHGSPSASPSQSMGDSHWNMSYMDFIPACLTRPGFMNLPEYEAFSTLVNKANRWLQQNPHVRVKVCESIEVKTYLGAGFVDTNSSLFFESGRRTSLFIRCLRCWIVPKTQKDPPEPQRLGYLNVVPHCLDDGGVLHSPEFEGYGHTLHRLNQIFQEQPLQGRILNVETQDIKFDMWGGGSFNPDITFWRESGKYNTYFLNIVRVFYEVGPPCFELIGSIDFVPGQVQQGGMFGMGLFEPMAVVVSRANEWMAQNPGLPVLNVQSVDYKLNQSWCGEELDTHRTLFREYGRYTTYYVRILRLYYAKNSSHPSRRPPIACLSHKNFIPCQLTTGGMLSIPQFETQAITMQRAMAWLKVTNARIMGCETVPVKIYGGGRKSMDSPWGNVDSERTYTHNSGRYSEHYVFVLRMYLDGYYDEPPPEVLPPLPQMTNGEAGDCCTIL